MLIEFMEFPFLLIRFLNEERCIWHTLLIALILVRFVSKIFSIIFAQRIQRATSM